MHGDFEAQRHWLEVTYHLPIGDWYRNTTTNNLLYWGLDYPPLTAYVSQWCAIGAQYYHPPLIEFETSHGHESPEGKFYMRTTVLILDFLISIPALILSFQLFYENFLSSKPTAASKSTSITTTNSWIYEFGLLIILYCPSLILIDHGHFQYNCVCIGFALLGSYYIMHNYDLVGSVFFCLSLNFKQMSLYYSPIFFFYLLRKCLEEKSAVEIIGKFISLGVTVIGTFAVLWFPFCLYHSPDETCVSSLLHVLSRQFPFARGIFEDKVSNLWYATSVAIDYRLYFTIPQLVRMSMGLTLSLLAPIGYNLLINPSGRHERMYLGLVLSSLAFFLASFQVLLFLVYFIFQLILVLS
jgi:alpha-1,3-glucosyltransferase